MVGEEKGWLQRFIIWRERNIKEKRFILLLSFLVGIFTAFAALILKVLIHWIQNFLTENFDTTEANYQYLIYPVVGIFLAGLFVRYVVKDDISHGVTKILYAISRRQGRIKRHNTWSSIIASSITIGFGGSVGQRHRLCSPVRLSAPIWEVCSGWSIARLCCWWDVALPALWRASLKLRLRDLCLHWKC